MQWYVMCLQKEIWLWTCFIKSSRFIEEGIGWKAICMYCFNGFLKGLWLSSHCLLRAKFKVYGLTNVACEFMSSYLSGRYQRVRLSNEKCSWEPVTKAISQGSGLEHIIFNIVINDAFYFIQKCDFDNYADDDTLSKIGSMMEYFMECSIHDSEVAIDFIEANPSKFQFVLLK